MAFTAILAAGTAQAAERAVYKGTVGPDDVVMELARKDSGVLEGRYVSLRDGVDIPLSGTPEALTQALPLGGDGPMFSEPVFDDATTGRPAVTWAGQTVGDRYEGQWQDARSGKALPFSLQKVATYDPDTRTPGNAAITMAATPYEYLKMQVPVTSGSEVELGPVAYRMVMDPRTLFGFPRITRHPDPAAMERANGLLEQRQWQLSLAALDCKATLYTSTGPAAGSLGGFDEEKVAVTYLSPALMSVTVSGSTDCGGAHPNNHFDPFTLDLRRGEDLDFNRLLDAWAPGPQGRVPSPALTAFIDRQDAAIKAANPYYDEAPTYGSVCDAETLKQYLALYLEADGKLAFAISGIGHAGGVCLGLRMTASEADLGPLLKPEAAQYLP